MRLLKSFLIILGVSLWGPFPVAIAADLKFSRERSKIFMSGACDAAERQFASLAEWQAQSSKSVQCLLPPPSPRSTGDAQCKYDISNCLPEHVNKYFGLKPKQNGPNCFNLALVFKGLLPALRYSSSDEMSFYMASPLCRPLQAGEEVQPGDVGAIRRDMLHATQEWHGFIFVSRDVVYSKDGVDKKSPFGLQSIEKMYKTYELEKGLKTGCTIQGRTKLYKCSSHVSVFRCRSLDEYLRSQPELPSQLRSALAETTVFENCLENFAVHGAHPAASAIGRLRTASQALIHYLEAEQAQKRAPDERTKFLLASLQLRLESVAEQLRLTKHHQDSAVLKDFAKALGRDVKRNLIP